MSKRPKHQANPSAGSGAVAPKPAFTGEPGRGRSSRHLEMPPSAKKNIAAAAVTAALLGAFGVGAFAAAQGDFSFDPQAFVSNRGGDASDGKGYRANPTQTNADANRHKDDTSSKDEKTAQLGRVDNTRDDAFTTADSGPQAVTAYNVTGSGNGDTVTVANGGTTANGGAATDPGATTPGLVVDPGANGNGGAGQGNGQNGGENQNPGGSSDPSNPGGGTDPYPGQSTTEDSYKVLPTDPDRTKESHSSGTLQFIPAGKGDAASDDASDDEIYNTIEYDPSSNGTALYNGQKLDAWNIFCSLMTTYNYNGTLYEWICSKDEFPTYAYFRVDSWSYTAADGTVVENPEYCPSATLTVQVSYRYRDGSEWHTKSVECTPSQSAVFVVSDELDESGNPQVLYSFTTEKVNLMGTTTLGKYLESKGYLYNGNDRQLSRILLNWTENGEPVDWIYTLTPGRHVVQPGKVADVPSGYDVRLQGYSMNDAYEVTPGGTNTGSNRFCYLQTLTDVSDGAFSNGFDSLDVPEGIQAVDTFRSAMSAGRTYLWSVGQLNIPDSVLFVNVDGPIDVQYGYSVSDGNLCYAATANGILTSKDGTKYLGVPDAMRSLDVPAGVESVSLTSSNTLDYVYVHGNADGSSPQIDIDKLNDCTLVVDDDAMAEFVQENHAQLEANADIYLAPASSPSTQLTYSGGMVFSEDELLRVVDTGSDTAFVQIPHTIHANAFKDCTDVTSIVLFDDVGPFTFQPGSLAGSAVDTIVCFSEEQADDVRSQLEAAGAPDADVVVASYSEEECFYFEHNGEVTLLSYQGFGMESFDGTLTSEDGEKIEVNAIAPYAFVGESSLEWVNLGPSVTRIGASAFRNCTSLQGFYMGAEDPTYIGTGAFEGCENLGFVASMSRNCETMSRETPNGDVTKWYCPDTVETGYDPRFTHIIGFNKLEVLTQDDGSLVLYGAHDETEDPWLLIAAGTSFNGTLRIEPQTIEIFEGALEGLSGSFDVDWSEAAQLEYIDAKAFKGSGLTGDIQVGNPQNKLEIAANAFAECYGMTSVTVEGQSIIVDDGAFTDCTGLKRAKFESAGTVDEDGNVADRFGVGVFSGCDMMENVEFTSLLPPKLNLFSPGAYFVFNGSWGAEEVLEHLTITIPEEAQEDYIQSWVYPFVGYANYEDYYGRVEDDLFAETWTWPSEAQVRERMAENLLEPENVIRQLAGMPLVEKSTVITEGGSTEVAGLTYTVGDDGSVTITGVDESIDYIDFDALIPDEYTNVKLAAGAITNMWCTGVNVGSKIGYIENGAFENVFLAEIQMPEDHVPYLVGGSEDEPFEFGGFATIYVPESMRQSYLELWPRECLGIDPDDFFAEADRVLTLWDEYPEQDALDQAVNGPYLEQENYLRGLMGLDPISSLDELAYRYDVSPLFEF